MAKSRTFSLLLVFVFLFSWCLTNIEYSFAGNQRHVIIYLTQYEKGQRGDIINHYKTSNFPVIETYESFFLSHVNTQQEKFLKDNKVNFSFIDGIGSLQFGGYEFKPDGSKNIEYPNDLRGRIGHYSPNDEAMFLLQFIGPIKNEWISDLNPGQYMLFPLSDFAYMVKTTENHARILRERREVSMIGYLPPMLKITPELRNMGPATVNLEIVTTANFNYSSFLNHHGIHENLASFSTIDSLGFFELKNQHTNNIGTFALHPRIISINEKMDVQLLNTYAAQIVRIRAADHSNIIPYYGNGQIIAVADSGLSTGDNETLHNAFQPANDRIVETFFYEYVAGNDNWADNTSQHGTMVAGTVLGDDGTNNKGMAPEAKLVFQSIKVPGSTGLATPGLATLFSDAYNAGARIHNNSWGSFGAGMNTYGSQAVAIDAYQWANKDFSVVFGAGNSGPGTGTISMQSNAKNNIAVGGTRNNRNNLNPDQVYTASSRGPAGDGRFKPDVVAPAQQIRTYRDVNTLSTTSGTSLATPIVSGSLALLREKYGNVTSALLKALLIHGAEGRSLIDQNEVSHICPNNIFGWGRIDVENSMDNNLAYWDVTGAQGLMTGDARTLNIEVYDPLTPLEVTLTYTDYPGTQGAGRALVNDLDLVVRGPEGEVFRGNQFGSNGYSITPAFLTDNRNNIERIVINSPLPGSYQIEVIGTSVTQGEPLTGRQPFALVASGSIIEHDPDDPVLPPSFNLEILPLHRELVQGDNTTFQARLTSENGAQGWVTMQPLQFAGGFGDPSNVGISYDYFPNNTVYLESNMTASLLIRISTSEGTTPIGNYPMTALAQLIEEDLGPMVSMRNFSMDIIQEPTFTLSLRPSHARIDQGQSTTTRITVHPRFEFNEHVSFDVSDLPVDATYTLDPNPTSSSMVHDYRSQLTIYTQRTTPVGVYPIYITGSAELENGKLVERTIVFNLEVLPRVSRRQVEVYRRAMPESLQIPCNERDRGGLTVRYRIQIRNVGNERLERNRIEIRLDPNLQFISSSPPGNFVDGILSIDIYDMNEPFNERPGDCWPARDCRGIGYPGLSDNDGHYLVIYARLSDAATRIATSTLLENRITFISDPYYTEVFPFYTVLHPCPGAEHPLYFRAYVENLRPDGTVGVNEEVRIRFKIEGGSGEYTYNWNWGDGNILNSQDLGDNEVILRHTYQRTGTFRIFIEARDSKGRYKKGEIVLRVQ